MSDKVARIFWYIWKVWELIAVSRSAWEVKLCYGLWTFSFSASISSLLFG